MHFPDWQREKWHDHPANPLITPERVKQPDKYGVLGDPQVILPGEFDDRWHMFIIGHAHFYRLDSTDGVHWDLVYDNMWTAGPPCVTCDGEKWIVLYSLHGWPDASSPGNWKLDWRRESVIVGRTSTDLLHWSEPVQVVAPVLDWEREGERIQVRNPNLVMLPDGKFRLYYCGGTVMMHDMGFEEPKYIGFVEADSALGPYVKREKPVLGPSPDIWYRNHGAGAIKVFRFGDAFLALENGIYIDPENRTHSAINVLMSEDGIAWQDASYNPIVIPSGNGWNKSHIYQLDLRWYDGKLWLFYNARDGWSPAREFIGLSTLEWDGPRPEKMWRLR